MVDNAGLGPAYAYGSPDIPPKMLPSSPVASPLVPLVPARSLASLASLPAAPTYLLTYLLT